MQEPQAYSGRKGRWIVGVLVLALFLALGIWCLVTHRDGGATSVSTSADVPMTQVAARSQWDIWAQLREAVRKSPDHLPAQAQRLVSSGGGSGLSAQQQAQAILSFVADQIVTVPANLHEYGGALAEAMNWGTRGTLRGGAGTPREKAELLAELYQRAGLAAEIVVGIPRDPPAIESIACGIEREFKPAIDVAALAEMRRALSLPPSDPGARAIDADGRQSAALGEWILARLPEASKTSRFEVNAKDTPIPLVKVTVGGQPRWANPMVAHAVLGESYTRYEPMAAGPATKTPTVQVRLAITTSDAPAQMRTVAEGQWQVADMVGRRLDVVFRPAEPLERLVRMPVSQMHTFVAGLALSGMDLDVAEAARLSVTGSMVTVLGDIGATDASGQARFNGRPIASGLPAPALLARVKSLMLTVDGGAFPEIRGRLSAVDADGKAVLGLPAGAFVVREGKQDMSPVIESPLPAPPRVLVVLDTSSSIPEAYRQAGAAAFVGNLSRLLLKEFPGAQVGVTTVGTAPNLEPPGWCAEASAVETAAGKAPAGFGSDLWTALSRASALEPTIVVCATDGQATDKPTQEILGRLQCGPPIVALRVSVDANGQACLDQIAAASGGKTAVVGPDQADKAIEIIRDYVKAPTCCPARLQYTACAAGEQTRTVTVSLTGGVSVLPATAAYTVPATATIAPSRLAGIHLCVTMDGQEVVRTLAGHTPTVALAPTAQELRQAWSGLFGWAALSFEACAPPPSVWLDEMVTARLSMRPLADALAKGDAAAIKDALVHKRFGVPRELPYLHARLAGDANRGGTFQTRPRVVLVAQRPDIGKATVRRVDLLPVTRFNTAGGDRAAAFRQTLIRTARLAIAEQEVFSSMYKPGGAGGRGATARTTASLLAGRKLRYVVPFDSPARAFGPLAAEHSAAWDWAFGGYMGWHKLVPEDGNEVAFWAVDAATGSVLGVLGDRSGGGEGLTPAQVTEREFAAISVLNDLLTDGYFPGLGISAWLAFEKAVIAQVYRATAAIANMETTGGIDGDQAIRDFANSVLSDVATNALTGLYPSDSSGVISPSLWNDIAGIFDRSMTIRVHVP